MALTWVEVSRSALTHNISIFRDMTSQARLGAVVKANAYGHGLLSVAQVALDAGADWLCVNALYEAKQLREAGFNCPIYVLGFVPADEAELVAELAVRTVIYHEEIAMAFSDAAQKRGTRIPLHIKLETGNNRQGIHSKSAVALAKTIHGLPGVFLEGVSSHYADIEDTTDHTFARQQLDQFNNAVDQLKQAGISPEIRSFSNSAATLLWPDTHFDLVRVGVSMYGMWPSKETLVSAHLNHVKPPVLKPAITWKAKVAQVKTINAGEYVGYGRSFQATHKTRLAVVPVGYYDGYDRGLSNLAHVLIRDRIAPIRGRVCMNMIMADITDIPDADVEDEVVLLGRSKTREISADLMAEWAHTINYEIPTRINDRIPRILID